MTIQRSVPVSPPPTEAVRPDLDGWREAMDRGRSFLGQDITFYLPTDPVWPPGTAINPETGRPYDPTVVPASGGEEEVVTLRVGVISPVVTTAARDQVEATAAGVERTDRAALDVNLAQGPTIQLAAAFTVNGIRFKITDIVPHGLTAPDRYVVFGEAQ